MSRFNEHESLVERYHAAIRAYTAAINAMEDARGARFHEAQRVADESRREFQRLRDELQDELGAPPLSEGPEPE